MIRPKPLPDPLPPTMRGDDWAQWNITEGVCVTVVKERDDLFPIVLLADLAVQLSDHLADRLARALQAARLFVDEQDKRRGGQAARRSADA